jgi:hypothetical protein
MIRALLFRVVLFILPFAIYEIYLILQKRQARTPMAQRKPWTKIFIAGLVLVVLSFVVEGIITGDPTSGIYVPAHMQNGTLVQGHVEEKAP